MATADVFSEIYIRYPLKELRIAEFLHAGDTWTATSWSERRSCMVRFVAKWSRKQEMMMLGQLEHDE